MPQTAKPKKRGPRVVTDQHKAAMAAGRVQSRAVRNYLEALKTLRPKRGRKRTQESVEKRLVEIGAELAIAGPLKELDLRQERRNLEEELKSFQTKRSAVDLPALERQFVKVAKSYGERKGISYGAWREIGVSTETLKAAGITRGS